MTLTQQDIDEMRALCERMPTRGWVCECRIVEGYGLVICDPCHHFHKYEVAVRSFIPKALAALEEREGKG